MLFRYAWYELEEVLNPSLLQGDVVKVVVDDVETIENAPKLAFSTIGRVYVEHSTIINP